MLIVGLTGNIACGKTTAANFFKKLGAQVIESDEIARGFTSPGTPQYAEILRFFGKDILDSEENINRTRLGSIVFSNKEKLKVLNKILHPPTIDKIKQEIEKCNKESILIIESALILETELKKVIDKLIVVKCSRHQQLARFKNKQLSVIEGKKRLKMQLPLSKKIGMADFVINNSKDMKNLSEQVKKIWDKLINENSSNNSICGAKPADGRKD